jgi:hypothetical protein
LVCFLNTDLLILQPLWDVVIQANTTFGSTNELFISGGRTNLKSHPDTFNGFDKLVKSALKKANLKIHSDAIDFFAFSRGLLPEIPPFLIGRMAWDQWLLGKAVSKGWTTVNPD